jgi:hypothetical protein
MTWQEHMIVLRDVALIFAFAACMLIVGVLIGRCM